MKIRTWARLDVKSILVPRLESKSFDITIFKKLRLRMLATLIPQLKI